MNSNAYTRRPADLLANYTDRISFIQLACNTVTLSHMYYRHISNGDCSVERTVTLGSACQKSVVPVLNHPWMRAEAGLLRGKKSGSPVLAADLRPCPALVLTALTCDAGVAAGGEGGAARAGSP